MIIASFTAFALLYTFIGSLAARNKNISDENYLVGGRSFGRYAIALSAGASAQSGFVMTGAVGMGYVMGLSALYWPIAWLVGDFIFWTFFPDKINKIARNSDSSTIPELIFGNEKGRGLASATKLCALITLVFVGIYTAANFLAAGKIINGVFDVSVNIGVIIAGVIILSYCAKGGLQSSIPTQAVQAVIMLLTAGSVFVYAVINLPPLPEVWTSIQNIEPTLLQFDYLDMGWLSILFFIGICGYAFCFNMSQPQLLIRLIAGESPEESKKAKWVYIGFMQLVWISMALLGMILRIALPDLEDPEQGLAVFAASEFSPLIQGLIIGGIFAAIASSLDALILVLSSTLSVDLAGRYTGNIARIFGRYYRIVETLLVTVVMILITVTLSASVFELVVFSAIGLSVTFGPVMLLKMLGIDLNPGLVSVCMILSLIMAAIWIGMGLNSLMLATLPCVCLSLFAYMLLKGKSHIGK